MILFLSPPIGLPQPSPWEADICCPYAPAAEKRDETSLQGQYLGHEAVLEAGLHPHLVSLHCPAPCQTSNTLFPAAAAPHLAERSPSPLQTQRSALFPSYTLQQPPTHPRLITFSFLDALGTHYTHQSTAGQCEAFQAMLNSFSQSHLTNLRPSSREMSIRQEKVFNK